MQRAIDAILTIVWAPRCAVCDEPLDAPTGGIVCRECRDGTTRIRPPVCDRCGASVVGVDAATAPVRCGTCRLTGGPVTARRAAGVHAGALRAMIHAFKYDGRRSLAALLAGWMREVGDDWLRDADVVVPVPLHPLRRWKRGFNQAADLAAALGPPVVYALRRARRTRPQVELSRGVRLRALRGAFTLARRTAGQPMATAIRDRSIVIVDDVITTGATVDACAAVLREAGARQVRALSVAQAAARGRPPCPRSRRPATARRRTPALGPPP